MKRAFTADTWCPATRPNPDAQIRLFCFPDIGVGASVFRAWPSVLPTWLEVRPVELPGRETRLAEPAFRSLMPLVEAVVHGVRPLLDRPFAVFGFGLGALLGFEVARHIRRQLAFEPLHLYVANRGAPQLAWPEPHVHEWSDDALAEYLRPRCEQAVEALENSSQASRMLACIRADLRMQETYEHLFEPPLACPVSVFVSARDSDGPSSSTDAWAEQTTGQFRRQSVPGAIVAARAEAGDVLALLKADLPSCRELTGGPGPNSKSWKGWHVPHAFPELGGREVHVWRVALDQSPMALEKCRRTLSTEEQARAERFYFLKDRDHFVAARGTVREILGRYVHRPPAELRFRYGPQGKPRLSDSGDQAPPHFNLTHAHGSP
jgi:medium-chain acyl-[acyl-carrier-protein] hydrolase